MSYIIKMERQKFAFFHHNVTGIKPGKGGKYSSMSNHKKKMVAPIVITVLVVLYYCVYFGVIVHLVGGVAAALLGIIPFALSAGMIYVCMERIREIKVGEEDDLSKY